MGRGADFLLGALVSAGFGWYLWLRAQKRLVRTLGGTYYAGMIKLKREMIEQYMQLHDATWEEVMGRMYECNMRDFVVWLHEETSTMFHQFVYVGKDFDSD
eukprot:CAMPEP_0119334950 /NCGR_PEP_ID=MMETSP1333-20130426/88406_1 /TAXON_ID=418940 /ORGANISM="Scyphosphaera apsteinii, Strain RCC1455" /LENGTH=100 /DNA_ID=CAMNT_0007345383 /DNA_START=48 /DNA_END=347 /DNA_ORIENTATION=-